MGRARSNYHEIFTIYPPFWPAVRHNLLWLAFLGVVATPLGLFLAVLLDKGDPVQPLLPERAVHAGGAVARRRRLHRPAGLLPRLRRAQRRARRTKTTRSTGSATRSINIWVMLVAAGLAAHRLRDDPLPGRAEGGRPVAEGGRRHRRRERAPDLLPGRRSRRCARSTSSCCVITVIEALRAFDIVYVVNSGRNGLELLSVLVTDNIIGEASRIGFGSAIAVLLLPDLPRLRHHVPGPGDPRGEGPMTTERPRRAHRTTAATRPVLAAAPQSAPAQAAAAAGPGRPARVPGRGRRSACSLPLLLAVYASLRPYDETARYGYFSLPQHLSFALLPAGLDRRRPAAVLPQHPDHRGARAWS